MYTHVDSYFAVRHTNEGKFFQTVVRDLTHGVILANEIKNRYPHTQPTIHNHMFHESYNERYELHTIYSPRGYIISTLERLIES